MRPITLYTVPSTVHDRLSQDVIVSRLQPNGRFVDTYVADLVDGDQFHVPTNELPPRSADIVLKFIGDNKLNWEWERGFPEHDEPHIVEIMRDGLNVLIRFPYKHEDHTGALREALEYVMDQEEL